MSEQNNVVALAEGLTADVFHQLLEVAIEGKGKMPGARSAARNLLGHHRDPEVAITWLVNQHIAYAGGQGFVTNWGGFFVALFTIPANMAAAAFLQARVVAGVAHLRGYDLSDARVRTAILMVMLGPGGNAGLISKGVLPSSPAAVATAPMFDAALDRHVSRELLDRAMNQMGGKRLGVWVGKRIPFVGGGVGAVVDGWCTRSIANHAMEEFTSRRPKLNSWTRD
ncbi:MAG: EcsC family protein [Propionibacteriaceae bacterium]|nr:EcsC family protein [Propionibacteriaceae bacterium]